MCRYYHPENINLEDLRMHLQLEISNITLQYQMNISKLQRAISLIQNSRMENNNKKITKKTKFIVKKTKKGKRKRIPKPTVEEFSTESPSDYSQVGSNEEDFSDSDESTSTGRDTEESKDDFEQSNQSTAKDDNEEPETSLPDKTKCEPKQLSPPKERESVTKTKRRESANKSISKQLDQEGDELDSNNEDLVSDTKGGKPKGCRYGNSCRYGDGCKFGHESSEKSTRDDNHIYMNEIRKMRGRMEKMSNNTPTPSSSSATRSGRGGSGELNDQIKNQSYTEDERTKQH